MENISNTILLAAMSSVAEGITLSDPHKHDNPIIFANKGFYALTGYTEAEVLGKNCRFLQGADTNADSVEVIQAALRNKTHCTVQLLNYRKDGSTFWNHVSIAPVYDEQGELVYFIGIQRDMTSDHLLTEQRKTHNNTLKHHYNELNHSMQILSDDIQAKLNALGEVIEDFRQVAGKDEQVQASYKTISRKFTELCGNVSLFATMLETNSNDILQYIKR